MLRQAAVVLLAVLVWASLPGVVAQQAATEDVDEPLEIGLEEAVEVRFVLVDFLVLDGAGRTVPGLKKSDFRLQIAGKRTQIETLDENCPVGTQNDPVAGTKPVPPPLPPSGEPHRIVIVFDYDHMTELALTYDLAQRMMEQYPGGEEEHMLVSLSEVVRVEVPFTRDLDEVRWALQRMRNDRELFAGNRSRATERRFFYRIKALFDILARYPGRKTVVLFSGPFGPDEFVNDLELRELSALSGISRTAVYPVDTAGLQAFQRFGGPEELRRLAVETGGRMTAQTNDIGLAYAKAQRDLGCTYTLGFRDERVRFDDNRRIQIKLPKRKGHRIVQPDYYVIRSSKKESRSLRETASLAPHLFESSDVRAGLFVVGMRGGDRWRALVNVEFTPPPEERVAGAVWKVEGYLRKPRGTTIRAFDTDLRLDADRVASDAPLRFRHEVSVPPGEYFVSLVVADRDGGRPRAAVHPAKLAKLPPKGTFVVGPVLGVAGEDGVDPVFDPVTEAGRPLAMLTSLCSVGELPRGPASLTWNIINPATGETVLQLPSAELTPTGRGAMKCHEHIGRLDPGDLPPGDYQVQAVARSSEYIAESGATTFTVSAPRDN